MITDPSTTSAQARHPAITAASIVCYIMGVGWSMGAPRTIAYMIRNRALRVIDSPFGQFRGMSGPFEALGMDAMILLAILFSTINLLYILAGYGLWKSQRKGGMLATSLLALSTVFWWGFALPFGLLVGPLLAGLLAVGWKSLREDIYR